MSVEVKERKEKRERERSVRERGERKVMASSFKGVTSLFLDTPKIQSELEVHSLLVKVNSLLNVSGNDECADCSGLKKNSKEREKTKEKKHPLFFFFKTTILCSFQFEILTSILE